MGTGTHARGRPRIARSVRRRTKEEHMATVELDAPAAEAFAERMLGVVNGAMLTLTISIGHRTGLYDTLAELEPATSDEIAAAAGLRERYVREWLAAQLVGGIVEHD